MVSKASTMSRSLNQNLMMQYQKAVGTIKEYKTLALEKKYIDEFRPINNEIRTIRLEIQRRMLASKSIIETVVVISLLIYLGLYFIISLLKLVK